MYCNQFGFRERPFSITPDPQFVYLSKNHKEAFAHLLYGIDNHAGFIELTGEVGTGKTTVLRTLLSQLGSDGYRTAFIFNPSLTSQELLRSIIQEFGIFASDTADSVPLSSLNRFLLQENALGRTVVLVIDEAQNLEPPVLEQIRLISNLETEKDKLIQIVLAGQPELAEKLARPELRQLNQRIMVRYRLRPMDHDDTVDYIEHRIAVASGRKLALFAPDAVRRIFRYSRGLPRLINLACDRALLLAYTKGFEEITARMADDAIADLGERPKRTVIERALSSLGLTGVILLMLLALYIGYANFGRAPNGTVSHGAVSVMSVIGKEAKPDLPASIDQVRTELGRRTEAESVVTAFRVISGFWGILPGETPAADLEVLAARNGFTMTGINCNLGTLIRMNQPAILDVGLPDGGRRLLALVGTEKGNLVVAPSVSGHVSISSAELESMWAGHSYIPWRNAFNIPLMVRPGDKGEHIRHLKKLLARSGFPPASATELYDSSTAGAVRKFQHARGLDPDGIVGARTLLLLYNAGGASQVPRLTREGGLAAR